MENPSSFRESGMDRSGNFRGRSRTHGGSGSILPNYRLGRQLGAGSFGIVQLAEHAATGCNVAIKTLSKQIIRMKNMEEIVNQEVKILRFFMHPHIVRLYEVIETCTHIYLVMEYVNSGELYTYLTERAHLRLSEDEARHFFQQIVCGVEHCHRNMVVHRDLKPENLLLNSKLDVKIADFGLSNIMRDGHFLKTCCGSRNYAAPEVISGNLYAGPEVDVWSCGVILYVLLCWALPFDDDHIPTLLEKIKGGIYALPSDLSVGARDLITRILVVDPLNRATIPEIKQHPWFQLRLPRYLAVPTPDAAQQARKLDEDVMRKVVQLGFNRIKLVESLHNRVQNQETVTYYLILDNQHHISNGYLSGHVTEAVVERPQFRSESPANSATMHVHDKGVAILRCQTERKWTLGLQSWAHPGEIMTEVLMALQELAVCWKKIGPYNMNCRWLPPLPMTRQEHLSMQEGPYANDGMHHTRDPRAAVKFEIQLYKTKEEKYLLDLQRIQGSQFAFLDLCTSFFAKLHVL